MVLAASLPSIKEVNLPICLVNDKLTKYYFILPEGELSEWSITDATVAVAVTVAPFILLTFVAFIYNFI